MKDDYWIMKLGPSEVVLVNASKSRCPPTQGRASTDESDTTVTTTKLDVKFFKASTKILYSFYKNNFFPCHQIRRISSKKPSYVMSFHMFNILSHVKEFHLCGYIDRGPCSLFCTSPGVFKG